MATEKCFCHLRDREGKIYVVKDKWARDSMPLVPNRPIYVSKTYAEIREDIAKDDINIWTSSDDRYAFWYTGFNRTAVVGDRFGCTCSSLDGYIFEITAEVVKVTVNRVFFKIIDNPPNEKDDFILYHNPKEIPLVIDEVIDLTSAGTTHEQIVVGYGNSIDSASLNKAPAIGERSIVFLKTADKYIYSVLLEITGPLNAQGFYPFKAVEVMLVNNPIEIPLIIDEVVDLTNAGTTHEKFVVGHTNSIDSGSLNKAPLIGERSLAHVKTADGYIYSALLEITGALNASGFYPFKVVELLLINSPTASGGRKKYQHLLTLKLMDSDGNEFEGYFTVNSIRKTPFNINNEGNEDNVLGILQSIGEGKAFIGQTFLDNDEDEFAVITEIDDGTYFNAIDITAGTVYYESFDILSVVRDEVIEITDEYIDEMLYEYNG